MAEQSQAKLQKDLHPTTKLILRRFEYNHLAPELQAVSKQFFELAWRMACGLPQDPEVTAGLRKLAEAKDCFVFAKVWEAVDLAAATEQTTPD